MIFKVEYGLALKTCVLVNVIAFDGRFPRPPLPQPHDIFHDNGENPMLSRSRSQTPQSENDRNL